LTQITQIIVNRINRPECRIELPTQSVLSSNKNRVAVLDISLSRVDFLEHDLPVPWNLNIHRCGRGRHLPRLGPGEHLDRPRAFEDTDRDLTTRCRHNRAPSRRPGRNEMG